MKRLRRFAALFALAGFGLALPQAAEALSYSLIDADLPSCKGECPKMIYATGTIGQYEHARFLEFLKEAASRHRLSSVVIINSGGGFNVGAFQLGFLLRKAKMTVVVGRPTGSGPVTRQSGLTSGTCASACVVVLAGGQKRFSIPGSRVGVHRANAGPEIMDAATGGRIKGNVNHEGVKSAYGRFFTLMGVNAQLAVLMDQTPAESMYWLNTSEMSKLKLASTFSSR